MRINRLRGTVADRPIDSRVIEPDPDPAHHESTMQQIDAIRRGQNPVREVDLSRLPTYDKG